MHSVVVVVVLVVVVLLKLQIWLQALYVEEKSSVMCLVCISF